MTAAEWDACVHPIRMLAAADARLSDRKLLLVACGCARRVWDRLTEAARAAVPRVEAAADDPDPDAREALVREATTAAAPLAWLGLLIFQPHVPARRLVPSAVTYLRHREAAADAIPLLSLAEQLLAPDQEVPHPGQAEILRCVAGNPFRRSRFDPAWHTSDVRAIAAGVYADAAFDRLPILADAFQDAGCTAARLLAHLRSGGPHARGCWAVDLVLGKS
jgi:hypothetical protein